jgi:hypothetical protein
LAPGTNTPATSTALISWTTRFPFSEMVSVMVSPFQNKRDTRFGVSQFEGDLQGFYCCIYIAEISPGRFNLSSAEARMA